MSTIPPSQEVSSEETSQSQRQESTGIVFTPVRLRAYIVGVVAVILVCIIVAFGELVASRGGSIDAILVGATHMPPAAIGVLVVLLFANAAVCKYGKWFKLNSAELAVIYFMLVIAALVSSFGLAAQLLPNLAGANYFASAQNLVWQEKLYPHIASWLVPWDPAGPEQQFVTKRFFEGLRVGESVPWDAWIVPIIAWVIFAFMLFFLMACVATLFRKQWVENEKLTFPLVQLPMEMANEETRAAFFSNKLMWIGFLLPAVVHGINGLHRSFPSVPELPVSYMVNQLFVTRPWNEMMYTPLNLSFSIVGFSYLLPLDVSFSFWFFFLFFRAQDLVRLGLGQELEVMPVYGASRYYQGMQSAGAFVTIAIMAFWLAKPHLKTVIARVFGDVGKEVDSNEYMSYRTAFWGGIISFLLILLWLKAAGMDPLVAFFMMAIFVFVVMLVLTRCVAEIGLLMLQPVFRPMDIWSVFAPKSMLGANNLTVMSFINGTFIRDPRGPMPAFMDSMKGAQMVQAKQRKMAIGAMIAVAVGVVAALLIQLYLIYHKGGIRLNSWFFQVNPTLYLNEANEITKGNAPFKPEVPIWFGVGSAFTFFLYAMRARFWWWPFHPIGYALGCAWPATVYWSSFFIGWLIKAQIQRYGGAKVYRNFRPFFLGLILGEFVSAIFWALLTMVFGYTSPSIPLG